MNSKYLDSTNTIFLVSSSHNCDSVIAKIQTNKKFLPSLDLIDTISFEQTSKTYENLTKKCFMKNIVRNFI